jgi:RNA polymerase sigma factor (sigma-70 family)
MRAANQMGKRQRNNFSDFDMSRHINLIRFICKRYVFAGFVTECDEEDFTHDVIERLMKRMPVLQKNFNGSVKPSTYLGVVASNICKELLRERKRKQIVFPTESFPAGQQDNLALQQLYFQDEMDKLEKIFFLFNRKRLKLEICLKVYRGVEFTVNELRRLPQIVNETLNEANKLNHLPKAKKADKYNALAQIASKLEERESNPEAIRKWLKSKITEVIDTLNGNPKHAAYDEESLGILLEKYYETNDVEIKGTG